MKILKFYSSTCGPCKLQTEWLKQLDNIDIEHINIEDDNSIEIINKYKIRNVPTLVLLDDKEEVLRVFNGLTKIEDIEKIIEYHGQK